MPDMRCFSTGGKKNQHDAILESFGTTQEIIISLTCLPPTTHYSFRLDSEHSSSVFLFLLSEIIPSQTLT